MGTLFKSKESFAGHHRHRRHAYRGSGFRLWRSVSTSPKHPSGTDRVAQVAAKLPHSRHIINVQGDEPAFEPRLIDQLVQALRREPMLRMVTAASSFDAAADVLSPHNVKVVTTRTAKRSISPAA